MNSIELNFLSRAQNELTEHFVYHRLSLMEKKPANRELLEKLSAQEKSHFEFWKSLLPDGGGEKIKPGNGALFITPLIRKFLGVTFTAKFLERHEDESIEEYEKMLPHMPSGKVDELKKIIEEEREHERLLISRLEEKRVSYIGFVALGLSDAIVEITGVHAGFLGVTGSTLIAGISGVIVGFAAAISMGSAAYLQAKQDPGKSPIHSALITGFSYMISVVFLALPYFLIRAMLGAFIVSSAVGIALLASFIFYGAIVFDRKFLREFGESAALMMGTALATYILGAVIGDAFHVGGASF